jgi:hypothetical protein
MITPRSARFPVGRTALASLTAVATLLALGACSPDAKSHRTPPHPTTTDVKCQRGGSAGCAPASPPAPAPAPAPLSLHTAQGVLSNYIRVNNAANKKRSLALNNTIETDTIRAQSRAEYRTYSRWTKDERDDLRPFSYLQPHFYIPRSSGSDQKPWFAVLAHYSTNKSTTSFMVFVRSGSTWKLSAETPISPGQTVPPIAVDAAGYAKSVDPDSTALAIRPSALHLAVTDNYTSGGTHEGAVFAASPDNSSQRKAHSDSKTFLRPYAASEFSAGEDPFADTYALATTDGGALVIASSVHNQSEHVIVPNGVITLGPHSRELAWVHSTRVPVLTTTYSCLDAAAIPRSGKLRLLGSDCEITGAE